MEEITEAEIRARVHAEVAVVKGSRNRLASLSAEEVRLQVWKLHGRWFACWVKPAVPEDAPDDERWEVLLVEEDKNEPGSLFYREL